MGRKGGIYFVFVFRHMPICFDWHFYGHLYCYSPCIKIGNMLYSATVLPGLLFVVLCQLLVVTEF